MDADQLLLLPILEDQFRTHCGKGWTKSHGDDTTVSWLLLRRYLSRQVWECRRSALEFLVVG